MATTREDDDDVQLMLAYQSGDEHAFRKLYDRNKHALFLWIYRMVRKESVAEELAQEVFLRVYRARYRYQPNAKFKTWLYTIAARLTFNESRKKSHLHEDSEEIIMNAQSTTPSPLDRLESGHWQRMISIYLGKLKERQRTALTLKYFEDLSNEEIGTILGLRVGAVKSLLHRGLIALEELISKDREGK